MIEKENDKYSSPVINNAKNEKYRKKLKILLRLIFEIKNKKSKDFQKAVKKYKNDENYEFNYPLIERNFLYKAVQEINKELKKNKEEFLIDFTSILHNFFQDELMLYWRLNGYITEDETLGINLVNEDFNLLNAIITEYTNDKEFIPFIKKLETDSTVIYIDAYSKHTVIVNFNQYIQ